MDGAPLSGGSVFFFNDTAGPPPSKDRYWRVSDYSAPLDNGGNFSLELPAGKYYLGAINRISGKTNFGPPEEGDLFFGAEDENGLPKAFVIKTGEQTNLGILTGAKPFKKALVKYRDGITAIEGTVLDPDGRPVSGALVFAYTTPSMTGKPLYASERTTGDGKYILRVRSGGTYYLKSRDKYKSGMPSMGDLAGSYGQEAFQTAVKKPATGIYVKTGEIITGIDIRTIKFTGRDIQAK
ncbi:MAG TPA: carboxypeptidase-like regulatory domain-containing protein [Thermodesulfovibrionales bacterium]|nr:carboxypeptidase-like regulatory domain-containing protein [Thermodesulfovibrionales bacterium]